MENLHLKLCSVANFVAKKSKASHKEYISLSMGYQFRLSTVSKPSPEFNEVFRIKCILHHKIVLDKIRKIEKLQCLTARCC